MFGVTDKALDEFKKVLGIEENKGLAIKIKASMSQSSCCSCGPSQSYEMGLVEDGDKGDSLMEFDGVRFFMDQDSMGLMDGFEVDFMEDQGFIVKDTNPSASCGCGDGGDHGGSCCG